MLETLGLMSTFSQNNTFKEVQNYIHYTSI